MTTGRPTHHLACLRRKPTADLMKFANQPNPNAAPTQLPEWSFFPVVDGPGGVLPDQPRALFARGEVAKVPYLLGSNNDEARLLLIGTKVTNEADYEAAVQVRFPRIATEVLARYPASMFNGDFNTALEHAVSDSQLICGTEKTARWAQSAGLPVFMYNFNMPWALGPDGPTTFKASHASEISHVFGNPVNPDRASQALSDAMTAYWTTFAATGDPNSGAAPAHWPAFKPDLDGNDQRLQLDADFKIIDNFKKDECTFWRAQRSV